MKKVLSVIFVIAVLVHIACKDVEKNVEKNIVEEILPNIEHEKVKEKLTATENIEENKVKEQPKNEKKDEPINYQNLDKGKLDAIIMEKAKEAGVDANDYRLFIRKDDDGTRIFRMLGMYVIQNPNGEEVYLPDEI